MQIFGVKFVYDASKTSYKQAVKEAAISANTIEQALKTIKNAEFIVHSGDIVENGSIESQWDWLLNGSK